jgi:hypothetical protein
MKAKSRNEDGQVRRPRGLRLAAALAAALGLALAARADVPRLISYQGRVSVGGVNFDGWGWFKFALVGAAEENVQATAVAMGFDAEGRFMAVDVLERGSGYTAAPAVTVVSGSGAGAVLEADVENGEVTGIRVIEVGAGYQDHDTTIQIGPPQAVPPPPPCYWSNTDRDPQTGEPYGAVGLPVSKGLYAVLLGDTALANMWEIPATVFTNADVRLRVWFDDDVHGSQRLAPDQRLAAAAYALEAHSAATARSVPDGSVTEAKLAMGAVTTMKIADGAVTGGAIAQNTISAQNLAEGAVTGVKLATGAALANLADGSVTGSKLATGAALANLADGSVTGSKLAVGAVSADKLATGAALANLADGSVTGSKLAAGAVSADKLATGAALANLANGSVTGSKLALDAVTNTKIADGAVSAGKLGAGAALANLANGSVTGDKLATDAVSGTKIADGAVSAGKLATGAVTGTKIADGAVGAGKLAPGAAAENLNAGGQSGVPSGGLVLSQSENQALLDAGYVRLDLTVATNEKWSRRSDVGAPGEREFFTAVWTGTEIVIWGGRGAGGCLDTGGRYDPATDTWTATSVTGAPAARDRHTAVWTGTEMIIWGGYGNGCAF